MWIVNDRTDVGVQHGPVGDHLPEGFFRRRDFRVYPHEAQFSWWVTLILIRAGSLNLSMENIAS